MERADLFATPLYSKDLENAATLNRALSADIAAWEAIDPDGHPRSNRATSWHSGTAAFEREAFGPLTKAVLEAATDVFRAEGYAGQSTARLVEMWANVLKPGGFNAIHDHGMALWSGVYYVTAPEGIGDLVLLDPRGNAPVLRRPSFGDARKGASASAAESGVSPRPGRLLMWPGWLQHYVEPHGGEEPRISVSFNIEQAVPPRRAEPTGVPAYVLVPEVLSRDDITRIYAQLAGSPWREAMVLSGRQPDIRNNQVMWADGAAESSPWHWLYVKLFRQARLVNEQVYKADIAGGGQPMQFARYRPGEKYETHIDATDDHSKEEGRRTLSCVVVLRSAERGGGSTFPRAIDKTPVQLAGDAIFFRADERHAARTVEAGVRDTLVVWFQKGAG